MTDKQGERIAEHYKHYFEASEDGLRDYWELVGRIEVALLPATEAGLRKALHREQFFCVHCGKLIVEGPDGWRHGSETGPYFCVTTYAEPFVTEKEKS